MACFMARRGEAGGEAGRDRLAKLGEDGQHRFGWFVIRHPVDPEWDCPAAILKNQKITVYGMAVISFLSFRKS